MKKPIRKPFRPALAFRLLAVLAFLLSVAAAPGHAARVTGDSSSASAGSAETAPAPKPKRTVRVREPRRFNPASRTAESPAPSAGEPRTAPVPPAEAEDPALARDAQGAAATGTATITPAGDEGDDGAPAKKKKRKKGGVRLDFKDASLEVVAQLISELSGKNFILDPSLKGKTVTIISPKPLSAAEAYKVFESILEINGLTTVESGKVVKIVPAADARGKSVETRLEPKKGAREDKVVTQVIPLKYASATEVQKVFQQLVSKNAVIVAYGPTNIVIVTDYLSNIQRLLRIVAVVDIAGAGQEIAVIPLKNAAAADMVKMLSTFFAQKRVPVGAQQGAAEDIKMVADERTNSIVVMASEVDVKTVRDVVAMLDKSVPRGKGKIHIYFLQNHSAEDVAKVLEKLIAAGAKPPADPAKKAETPVLTTGIQISPDKATNSLVIMAQPEDYPVLEGVIRKLDIPRPMVYIEALIMEVSTQKDFQLGVEWRAGDDFTVNGGKGVYFGGSGGNGTSGAYSIIPSPTVTTAGAAASFPTGFSVGVMGEAIKVGDVVFPTIGAVVRAYQNDSDVHILSAPQLLTTNNEEAKITVGKNVPYVTRQETSTASVDYSTYEYKDVGVTLKLTPQISQARTVRLKVFQEVSRLIDTGNVDRPTTYKRSTETTVIVKDGQTIVIGGLIDRSSEGTIYRVPCLGDIPVIGPAFRSTGESQERTNLYVFLTPHIIEQPGEAKGVTEEKKEDLERMEADTVRLFGRTSSELQETLRSMTLEGPAEGSAPTPTVAPPSDEPEKPVPDQRTSGSVKVRSRPSQEPSSAGSSSGGAQVTTYTGPGSAPEAPSPAPMSMPYLPGSSSSPPPGGN